MDAFDETDKHSPHVDFDYAEVDRHLSNQPIEDAGEFMEVFRRVFNWMYQTPCEDLNGFFCRAVVVCWVFLPELRGKSMTYIAGRFGKKKQSIERWTKDFKKEFPVLVRLQHFQHKKKSK